MVEQLYEAFITLFVVIDPFGIVPMFIALTYGHTKQEKRRIAIKATCISALLLLIFAVLGDFLLDSLHISHASFRIAGGLLLLIAAIDMVVARHSGITSTTRDEQEEADHRADISVFPLAFPLIAGPGGLTTIMILMREAEPDIPTQAGIIAVLILVLALTYGFLRFDDYIQKWLGVTGTNVMTRIFGVILAALAVQFIMDGLKTSLFAH
jgi:multiple antibiotic resistance protein